MIADGAIETRPGDDDPGAIELLTQTRSRQPPPLARDRSRCTSPYAGVCLTCCPDRAIQRDLGSSPRGSRHFCSTESSIGSVSLPVNVFCWLGWYEQTT